MLLVLRARGNKHFFPNSSYIDETLECLMLYNDAMMYWHDSVVLDFTINFLYTGYSLLSFPCSYTCKT